MLRIEKRHKITLRKPFIKVLLHIFIETLIPGLNNNLIK